MAVEPKKGMQILDCCAAPGGKSCLMAEMMGGSGRVQAWELHEHRTDLITAQVKRLGLENVRPMTRDAGLRRPDLDNTMDAVLLDAPCSGLGVMADKPDVKYRVTPESVEEIVRTQRQLLDAVAPYVKRGGTLVYSTCSVLKEENVRQAEAFLERHPEFELMKLPEIGEPLRALQQTDVLLYGVGRADVMARNRLRPESEIASILRMGAVGEAVGCYFDASGRPLFQASGVGLTCEQVSRVRCIVAVAAGASKARAILSVLKHHHHELLVIDEGAARAIEKLL
jgi:hypothetical protein